jgi:hypothetical protein
MHRLKHCPSVILTNAQIKALPTTPIEIVAAPGVGKAILADAFIQQGGFMFVFNWVANYGNVDSSATVDFTLGNNGPHTNYGATNKVNEILTSWGDSLIWEPSYNDVAGGGVNYNSLTDLANKAVFISMTNVAGNLTDGDAGNTIAITILYTVVDL